MFSKTCREIWQPIVSSSQCCWQGTWQGTSSASSQQITSDVPATTPAIKKPGRVAVGERLAEHNRQAPKVKKEAAAAEPRAAKDTPTAPDTTHSKPAPDSDSSGYYILGIGSLIVSALGVYYQREAILNALGRNEPTEGVKTIPQPRNEPAEEVKTIPPEKTPSRIRHMK